MSKKEYDILLGLAMRQLDHLILNLLNWSDICNCMLVNKEWNSFIQEAQYIWEPKQRADNLLCGKVGPVQPFVRGVSPPLEFPYNVTEILDEVNMLKFRCWEF